MPAAQRSEFRFYPVLLSRWDVRVVFVLTQDETMYVPIRPLCRELGIDSPSQLARIKQNPKLARGLLEVPMPTSKGERPTFALRRRECASWIADIDPDRVKAKVRGKLREFQSDVMAAADRLLFGDLSGVYRSTVEHRHATGEIRGECPRCGAPLILVIGGEGRPCFEIDERGDA